MVGLVRPRPHSPSLRKSNKQQSSCFVQVSRHRGFQFPRAPTTNNSTNTNNTAALFEPHAIQGFVQSFPGFVTVAYSPRAIMSVNVNMDMQKPPQKQAHVLPASVNNLSFARPIQNWHNPWSIPKEILIKSLKRYSPNAYESRIPRVSPEPICSGVEVPIREGSQRVFHDHARLPRLEASACGRSPLALLSARRAAYAGSRAAGTAEWWPSELDDLVEGLEARACWGGLPHTSSLSFYPRGQRLLTRACTVCLSVETNIELWRQA